jgi:hypothetical protein
MTEVFVCVALVECAATADNDAFNVSMYFMLHWYTILIIAKKPTSTIRTPTLYFLQQAKRLADTGGDGVLVVVVDALSTTPCHFGW